MTSTSRISLFSSSQWSPVPCCRPCRVQRPIVLTVRWRSLIPTKVSNYCRGIWIKSWSTNQWWCTLSLDSSQPQKHQQIFNYYVETSVCALPDTSTTSTATSVTSQKYISFESFPRLSLSTKQSTIVVRPIKSETTSTYSLTKYNLNIVPMAQWRASTKSNIPSMKMTFS